MRKKQKKLNKLKIRRCLIIGFEVIIFLLILICSNIIRKNKEYKNLSILLDDEFIKTKNDVVLEDDNIYFSKDDIQSIFDETIYYNEVEKELITTYNTHIALLKVDETYGLINDENIELKGNLKEISGKIYLPLTDLGVVYDLDIRYSKTTNRIIMETTTKEKKEAVAVKRTSIKKKNSLFSSKIEKLIIGDKVTIIEDCGRYKKVKSASGNIGYIKSKTLSDETIVREKVETQNKELNVYKNYSNISGIYDNIQVDSSKLNVVIPIFFYIDKNSKVLDRTTSSTATYAVYKNWIDTNNLQILPGLNDNENVSESLLSYSQRSQIINSLKELVLKYNFVGINIDFDSIDDINSFYRFILELAPRFKASGLKVAITLNNNLDRNRIEKIVDYIVEE